MKLYLIYNDTISSVKYSKITEDLTTPSTKLYFKVPSNWSKCYLHYYPNPLNDLPGDEIFIGDSGYYEWDFSDLLTTNPNLNDQYFQLCQSTSDYIAFDTSFTLTDRGNVYELTGTTGNYSINVIDNIPGNIVVENALAGINSDSTGTYIAIPDELLNNKLNIIVNDTLTIPVMLSNSTWLDEIDVNAYTENNNYIAKVNKRASEYVRYKDLYKILQHLTSSTIDRIHETLGY